MQADRSRGVALKAAAAEAAWWTVGAVRFSSERLLAGQTQAGG
jgi:hypothetical protein